MFKQEIFEEIIGDKVILYKLQVVDTYDITNGVDDEFEIVAVNGNNELLITNNIFEFKCKNPFEKDRDEITDTRDWFPLLAYSTYPELKKAINMADAKFNLPKHIIADLVRLYVSSTDDKTKMVSLTHTITKVLRFYPYEAAQVITGTERIHDKRQIKRYKDQINAILKPDTADYFTQPCDYHGFTKSYCIPRWDNKVIFKVVIGENITNDDDKIQYFHFHDGKLTIGNRIISRCFDPEINYIEFLQS